MHGAITRSTYRDPDNWGFLATIAQNSPCMILSEYIEVCFDIPYAISRYEQVAIFHEQHDSATRGAPEGA